MGLRYENPVYDLPLLTGGKRDRIRDAGLATGVRLGASGRFIQPTCWIGPACTAWAASAPHDPTAMRAFVEYKRAAMDDALRAALSERGLSLDDLRPHPLNPAEVEQLSTHRVPHDPELGRHADRLVSLGLSPLWWVLRGVFNARRLL